MMGVNSLADGQRELRSFMDEQTTRPKFLICNEGDEGGAQTAQRLLTPLLDLKNYVVILTTNQSTPSLPYHDRFNDRIVKSLKLEMTEDLRNKIVDRKIAEITGPLKLGCPATVRLQFYGYAHKEGIRAVANKIAVSAYRSKEDGHSNLFMYTL